MARHDPARPLIRPPPWRWWPHGVLLVLGLAGAGLALYWLVRIVNIDTLATHYGELVALQRAHPVWAALIIGTVYALAIAVSVPASWVFNLVCGLVLGWAVGGAVAVVAATLGASGVFIAARTVLARRVRRWAGLWMARLARGFRRDAASYLLFLRLVPAVPFFAVNLVPAVLGVRFSTFLWTTAIGIVPTTMAYVLAGDGLGAVMSVRARACAAGVPPCGEPLAGSDLVNPQLLIGIAMIGVLALVPVVLRRLRRHKSA